jgi:hypothetical protein
MHSIDCQVAFLQEKDPASNGMEIRGVHDEQGDTEEFKHPTYYCPEMSHFNAKAHCNMRELPNVLNGQSRWLSSSRAEPYETLRGI